MNHDNSSLRRQIRNLRAKVRSLLPQEICCRWEQRNKVLCKMQHRHKEHRRQVAHWNHNKQNEHQWWLDKFEEVSPKEMFSKLDSCEIEQIVEDKQYFLGNVYTKYFDQFLCKSQNNCQVEKSRKSASRNRLNFSKPIPDYHSRSMEFSRQCYEKQLKAQSRVRLMENQRENERMTTEIMTEKKQQRAIANQIVRKERRTKDIKIKKQKWEQTMWRVQETEQEAREATQIHNLSRKLKEICIKRLKQQSQ